MKDINDKQIFGLEDLILWHDGTACYRYELHEMYFKSDDFIAISFGTEEYNKFFEEKNSE